MLQLGWKAGAEQYPPDELLDYATAAEAAGFDSVSASDHFHPWAEKGQASFIWSWLGAVAARTKKIVLGTGLTCAILRYHPAVIAQAAATMSCLAPGRFFLGVGTGEALNEYAATGQWPAYNHRRAALEEAIALMRALWSGEQVTHRGVYYETQKARLYTAPKSSIPIYVSAMVPNSAAFAGQQGDGLMTAGGEPETQKKILENFASGAKEAGKKPAQMPKMIEIGVAYTANKKEAIEIRKAYWAGTMIPALFTERIYTPEMSEKNGAPVGADTIAQSVCISDDPDEHVKNAQACIDAGFDHLIFHSAGPDQMAFIKSYGREVLPRLRQKTKTAQKEPA